MRIPPRLDDTRVLSSLIREADDDTTLGELRRQASEIVRDRYEMREGISFELESAIDKMERSDVNAYFLSMIMGTAPQSYVLQNVLGREGYANLKEMINDMS